MDGPPASELATNMIALYKRMRTTGQYGALYRILSPRTSDVTANEYVARDGKEGVLFLFHIPQQYATAAPATGRVS